MRILLIGCGNIGSALLELWVTQATKHEIIVIQPSLTQESSFRNHVNVSFIKHINDIPANFVEEITVIALKPQQIKQITTYLANRTNNSTIISVLAGIKMQQLQELLPKHNNIIRLMPNVGITTGNSVNLTFASKNTTNEAIINFQHIIKPSGEIFFLKQESQIDYLSPIFGSSPAYFFLLTNLLKEEAINIGIEPVTANKLATQAFLGSASLVEKDHNDYEALIKSVTSKKGVTEAALQILTPELKSILKSSIKAGLEKIEQLSLELNHLE